MRASLGSPAVDTAEEVPIRRRSIIRRGSALVSSAVAAVLLAGCGGEAAGEAPVGLGSSSSASITTAAPATSQPAEATLSSEDSQNSENSQSSENSQNEGTGGATSGA